MRTKRWNTMLSLVLVGILILLAGCQSVGNVDVGKAMAGSLAVKSSEGKQTVTLELTPDPAVTMSPEGKRVFDLFSKVKIDITEMKMQDQLHGSMKGEFEYQKGRVPFELVMSDMNYTLKIEGAKKPIMIRNSETAAAELPKELQEQLQQLSKKAVEVVPSLTPLFTRNFPNPSKITAADVNETVNGEALTLQKVHAEIYGNELLGLVKGFLTNVLADDQGLKDFIGVLYDLYVPILKEATKEIENDTITPYLSNKALAVEFIHTFLKTHLEQMLKDFDASVNEMGPEAKAWLSDNQSLKMDLYVDKDYVTRKSNTEIGFTLPQGKGDGLKSVKITSVYEVWNVNKPVQAATIDTAGGVIEMNGADGRLTAGKFVASLDPNSQLYKLLKDDLGVTKKNISMIVGEDKEMSFGTLPYNDNGTIMVPARFVVEELDADVKWDAATKQVKVTDPLNGTALVLTIGSDEATVNGKTVKLEKPAVLVEGVTYVPVRVVSEGLGAKVGWEQATQTVKITRD
ncbi:copper amine oxidase N-terminal domain-containing protein [Paenibacillus sp. MZ04-78.2]|uniref:copper amine oxidase N-terminal domain-containing protein n=1 Tax=Paenibacillus sp. MZ04-78.2 TaxID=2962034 RepID=UPI0020B671D9|nr:copper amine oxidase N-terminal domain-containing protein [Paenibacillus sp. MZ04-78.2]MCP3774711.1 copper amine oxidase N-terminal domain-containing protein [Paenibacillus sp. MZ04-78.2]